MAKILVLKFGDCLCQLLLDFCPYYSALCFFAQSYPLTRLSLHAKSLAGWLSNNILPARLCRSWCSRPLAVGLQLAFVVPLRLQLSRHL